MSDSCRRSPIRAESDERACHSKTESDEPGVGIDGLLGLSYLNHFDYRLDQQHPNKLILKPKGDH
jgi:hypothetical protein